MVVPERALFMIVVLTGGVGGTKLIEGLSHTVSPESIVAIVNTGDDFQLHGFHISPDVDTVIYTLSGMVNRKAGWGVDGDKSNCLRALEKLGLETWFQLGDRDLAMHIYRSWWLSRGRTLTEVTSEVAKQLGVKTSILPMTNEYVPTWVKTPQGEMHFQEYFVRERTDPVVLELKYTNIQSAFPAPGVLESIEHAGVIIFAPSNPFVSIGPILSLPGMRGALENTRASIIAVSPIVGGCALRGPAAKMLAELGHEVSAVGVAQIYRDIVDCFVIDECDAELESRITQLNMRVAVTPTVMDTLDDKCQLAAEMLRWVRT